MPFKEKSQCLHAQREHIKQLRASVETGKIAAIKTKLETKLKNILTEVERDLRSNRNRQMVLAQRSKTVHEMLCRGISISDSFRQFTDWISQEIKKSVEECLLSEFRDEKGESLPVLNKLLSSAQRMMDEGNTAMPKGSSWFGRVITTMKRWFGSLPGKSDYIKRINEVCAGGNTELKEVILSIVKTTCRPAVVLYKEIPEQIEELELTSGKTWEKTTTDLNQIKAHLNECKVFSKECDLMRKEVAVFTLGLDIHEYVAEDLDLPLNKESSRVAWSSRMIVHLPVLGNALMKVKEIFPSTAIDLRKFSECLRKINHKCIVKYYGSVWLSDVIPRTIGLLFESFPLTLADKIFTRREQLTVDAGEMKKTKFALLGTLEGLCYLHDTLKMAHRYIVPENIMLSASETVVKLGGMGLPYDDGLPQYYAAPEVLKKAKFSTSSDMYSFGTLLWAVWNGISPHPKSFITAVDLTAKLSQGFIADVMDDLEESHNSKQIRRKWDTLMKACWSQKSLTASIAKSTLGSL
eukprot:m.116775 g.116775  ORF g.116775 m.116775 type:complete len:522 (+) comp37590_c0_seq1:258-1823(+)